MGEMLTRPIPVEESLGLRLPRLGSVDAVGLEERAATLAARVIEGAAELEALRLAVKLLEVTALGRTETPGSAREICARAKRPAPGDRSVPPVAAVCMASALVPLCHDWLNGAGVLVAAFVAPADARQAMDAGADEIEIAFDAGAFLAGRYALLVDQIARVKEAIGGAAFLTVVVEPPGLGGYDELRRASLLAMLSGADFVGLSPASLPAALCVLEAIRDVRDETGHIVGLKTGGIRMADDALRQLILVRETLGAAALTPDRYRLGGTILLDELVREFRAASADELRDIAPR